MKALTILAEVENYIRKVQDASDKEYRDHYPTLYEAGKISRYSFTTGPKYYKVIDNMSNVQQSVFCFIDRSNGDIYKADSWSRPAKHVRGNIFNENVPLTLGSLYMR